MLFEQVVTCLQMTNSNQPDFSRLVATWWNWQVYCNFLTVSNKPVKLTNLQQLQYLWLCTGFHVACMVKKIQYANHSSTLCSISQLHFLFCTNAENEQSQIIKLSAQYLRLLLANGLVLFTLIWFIILFLYEFASYKLFWFVHDHIFGTHFDLWLGLENLHELYSACWF